MGHNSSHSVRHLPPPRQNSESRDVYMATRVLPVPARTEWSMFPDVSHPRVIRVLAKGAYSVRLRFLDRAAHDDGNRPLRMQESTAADLRARSARLLPAAVASSIFTTASPSDIPSKVPAEHLTQGASSQLQYCSMSVTERNTPSDVELCRR
jgi:hypothetical protein